MARYEKWVRPKSRAEGRAKFYAKQVAMGTRKPSDIPAKADIKLVQKEYEKLEAEKVAKITSERARVQREAKVVEEKRQIAQAIQEREEIPTKKRLPTREEIKGEIRPADKPPSFAQKVRAKARKKLGYDPAGRTIYGFGGSLITLPRDIYQTIRHPIKTTKETALFGYEIATKKRFITPEEVGSIGAMFIGGKILGVGVKAGVGKYKISQAKVGEPFIKTKITTYDGLPSEIKGEVRVPVDYKKLFKPETYYYKLEGLGDLRTFKGVQRALIKPKIREIGIKIIGDKKLKAVPEYEVLIPEVKQKLGLGEFDIKVKPSYVKKGKVVKPLPDKTKIEVRGEPIIKGYKTPKEYAFPYKPYVSEAIARTKTIISRKRFIRKPKITKAKGLEMGEALLIKKRGELSLFELKGKGYKGLTLVERKKLFKEIKPIKEKAPSKLILKQELQQPFLYLAPETIAKATKEAVKLDLSKTIPSKPMVIPKIKYDMPSLFEGKGMYERMDLYAPQDFSQMLKEDQMFKEATKQITRPLQKEKVTTLQKQKLGLIRTQMFKEKGLQLEEFLPIQATTQLQAQIQKQKLKVGLALKKVSIAPMPYDMALFMPSITGFLPPITFDIKAKKKLKKEGLTFDRMYMYKPSLLGIFRGIEILKPREKLTGIEVREPVKRKRIKK